LISGELEEVCSLAIVPGQAATAVPIEEPEIELAGGRSEVCG
jgi:hypothetical protein